MREEVLGAGVGQSVGELNRDRTGVDARLVFPLEGVIHTYLSLAERPLRSAVALPHTSAAAL
jgi:hypothetical protein